MITRERATVAGCAALLLFLAACGTDSTGPSTLDANAALQSLALGMGTNGTSSVYGPSSLSSLAPQLDQINVTIDGKSQSMFALGLRETYPTGTCIETLIVDPLIVNPPGQCTSPPFAFALILWQSHSAVTPPDRLALIAGNVGTINFEDLTTIPDAVPAFAIYTDGRNDVWVSVSGTLTSKRGTASIISGYLSVDRFSFTINIPIEGSPADVVFSGTFDGTALKGTIRVQGFSLDFTGVKPTNTTTATAVLGGAQ